MKKTPERTLLRLLHHNWNKHTLNAVSYVCERFLLPGCFSEVQFSRPGVGAGQGPQGPAADLRS